MLGSVVRAVRRIAPKKVPNIQKPNSGSRRIAARPLRCVSYTKWRVQYSSSVSLEFDPKPAPEKPSQGLDFQELADALKQRPPTREELVKVAQEYMRQTGKPLFPPPVSSEAPDTKMLNSVLRSHLAAFEYAQIRAQWLIALKNKVLPDNETFTLLIKSFVQAKTYSMIEPVEQLMESLIVTKTLDVCNALLLWCAETGNHGKADTIWKKVMEPENIAPDIRSIDYYMQAHSFAPEHFHIVIEVFKEYPKKYSCEVDTEMQGSLMAALLRNGKEELAMKRWEAMKSGKLPAPTNKTVNAMMRHIASQGQDERVQELFDSLTAQWGLYPDKDDYAVLMEVKLKHGEYDEVKKLVWRLCAEGWPIAPQIMLDLMSHYEHKMRDGATVEQLWALIPKAKITPDFLMLTVLVTSCLRVGNVDRAMAYLYLSRERYQLTATRTIYAAIIGLYGQKQQLARAMDVYRDMIIKDKIQPGPTTFVALLLAYARNGQPHGVLKMLKNPAPHGIPNINRHFFEDAIHAIENGLDNPLGSLANFDWTRLQQITSETYEEIETLNSTLSGSSV